MQNEEQCTNNIPQTGKKLFSSDGQFGEYAHIAWGNTKTQFYGYIVGYKEAADVIIRHALEKGDNHTLDTCVFPACFLYRQYLELALKDIYLSNTKETKEEKSQTLKECSHNLKKIWLKVRPLIIFDFSNDDKTDLDALEDYIKQFADEDSGSYAFRYPITKDLDIIKDKGKSIDLVNLAKRMSELENVLSAISMGMSANRDKEDEYLTFCYENELKD